VQYEAAHTLTVLSNAPTAIRAAAQCYLKLLVSASDNNVKLVVLDRLLQLRKGHIKVLQRLVMDVLRALQSPAPDIRSKTLQLALDLVSPVNVREVVSTLKKELLRSQQTGFEGGPLYRQQLVRAIHQCALRFPDVASDVVHALLDFIGDETSDGMSEKAAASTGGSATEVVAFVREVLATYPALRSAIFQRLLQSLDQIRAARVYRAALWLVGEYAESPDELRAALNTVKALTGGARLTPLASNGAPAPANVPAAAPTMAAPRVLSDGTYATASAISQAAPSPAGSAASTTTTGASYLHELLLQGDAFTGAVLAVTLTKLALKVLAVPQLAGAPANRVQATVLLYLASLLRLATAVRTVDSDSYERIVVCLKVLSDVQGAAKEPKSPVYEALLHRSKQSFAAYLDVQQALLKAQLEKEQESKPTASIDELPIIRQLTHKARGMQLASEGTFMLFRSCIFGFSDRAL